MKEFKNWLFFAQLLMGDATDNIPSLKKGKYGDKTAYKLLAGLQTEEQLFNAVLMEYKTVLPDSILEQMEQIYEEYFGGKE